MISKFTEEHSKRIFWFLQTVFAFVLAQSFYQFVDLFIPPYGDEIPTLTIASISVYSLIVLSWIDFSFTIIRAPYHLKFAREKIRFFTDLFIVLLFTYVLHYLDYVYKDPERNILGLFIGYCFIYLGYLLSGLLRRLQYGKRASRINIIGFFILAFLSVAFAYSSLRESSKSPLLVNQIFLSITFGLIILHPSITKVLGKRKYKIAIDVDGVLANQIDGVLPIIKKELNIDLKYNDVIDWKFPLDSTTIDRVIVNEQKHRAYIVGMPLHSGAKQVVDELIRKHYISIATARPPESDNWTKEWLHKNHIIYDSYHNLKEGLKHNEDFDVLIDDYPGNIVAYLEKHNGTAILFSQPWNRDYKNLQNFLDSGRLLIAKNWSEIPAMVKNIFR